jgi:hypothetical protein
LSLFKIFKITTCFGLNWPSLSVNSCFLRRLLLFYSVMLVRPFVFRVCNIVFTRLPVRILPGTSCYRLFLVAIWKIVFQIHNYLQNFCHHSQTFEHLIQCNTISSYEGTSFRNLILGVCILLHVRDQGKGVFRLRNVNIVGFSFLLFIWLLHVSVIRPSSSRHIFQNFTLLYFTDNGSIFF